MRDAQTPSAPERRGDVAVTDLSGIDRLITNDVTPFVNGGNDIDANNDVASEYGSVVSGAGDDESIGLNTAGIGRRNLGIEFGPDDEEESVSDGSVYSFGSDSEDEYEYEYDDHFPEQ